MEIKKGDLFYISHYNQFDGDRPVVVVGSNECIQENDFVTVAYLSSSYKIQTGRTHIKLRASGRQSHAVIERVTTIPKTRFKKYIGHVNKAEETAIDSALCVVFGL